MLTTEVYGRIRIDAPPETERAVVLAPDGGTQAVMPYDCHDAVFTYDAHGYETVTLNGVKRRQAAFTACIPGKHALRAYSASGDLLSETEFNAIPSGKHGYVQVSKRDPRYFTLSDGAPYAPIGLNLVGCEYDRLPAGMEHFEASQQSATTGLLQWKRWFGRMRENGVNYARVWVSNRYTEARTEIMGVHDPVALERFAAVAEMAREHGVRLKLCFEHWRTFVNTSHFAFRRYVDPDTGKQLLNEDEWFLSEKWNALWLKDIEPYVARYQNDPVVFAWELWNEIDCGTAKFPSVTEFTRRMLDGIRALSPKNLVVNSLGSFDEESKQARQDCFRDMPQMDFQQVHRYLDQGAPMTICGGDPIAFSIEAVQRARRADKPVILTETGAVNDRHVGPFRFYQCDDDGLIFHDVTYPALFAGAAGSGHIWHWGEYVEAKNLWRHFKPLADAFEGVALDAEAFEPEVIPDANAWILLLRGRSLALAYVRNKADRWDYVLRDAAAPGAVKGLSVPVACGSAEAFWLMDENPGAAIVRGGGVDLPDFTHGCVLKMKL